MEESKKSRIKRALGQLKELMVNKKVTLRDEGGYNLFRKERDGELVKYLAGANGENLVFSEPEREITLE
jgi:hypothetical protein